ncbi:MAG TPA: EAL domain-containing protein [Hydrogenothermaceae bacterium]|nr:EAL domain-containing protein [Hydrogenothermaceae bacterium]
MNYLGELKDFLPKVFKEIREDILNDSDTYFFIKDKKVIEDLIKTQEEILSSYLEGFPHQNDIEISKLKEFYKNLKIPYFVISKNIDLLKIKLLERISIEKEISSKEFLLEIKTYIENLENMIAYQYILSEIENIKELAESPFTKYLLYNQHISFLQQIYSSIKENNLSKFPIITAKECDFYKYLSYPESVMVCLDSNLCTYLEKLHDVIHQTSNVFFVFFSKGKYKEAYASLKGLIENSMNLSKTLAGLYFTAFSDTETNFFKTLKYLVDNSNSGNFIFIIDIYKQRFLNQIYNEEKVNKILKETYKALEELVKDKRENILLIKGYTANFYMLATNVTEEFCKELISKIKSSVEKSCKINGHFIDLKVSISVLRLNKYSEFSYTDLVQILHHLKELAKLNENRIYLATSEKEEQEIKDWLNKKYKDRFFIQSKLKQKMIEVVFQPIFSIKEENIVHLESLARIKKDDGSLIPAGVFIDLVYELDLITKLDSLVLESILLKKDLIKKMSNKLFLNLSYESLTNPDFLNDLSIFMKEMKDFEITFEITEQKLVKDISIIENIKQEFGNVRFAIDDFGSGYSSLRTVIELIESNCLQILKIDGSLIKELPNRRFVQKVVKAISSMADALNVKTVAEFVEDSKTLNLLNDYNINFAQGYYLSKPKTIEELILEKAI